MMMQPTTIADLPASPDPDLSARYMFIDTRKVIEDMKDLGYEVADFRRPLTRTAKGPYGLHEVDFRRPKDLRKKAPEAPRVLFMNSYDGSRRAQIISGLIRFACSNGLVVGDIVEKHKFLHLGNYEEELMKQVKASAEVTSKVFARLDELRKIFPDRPTARKFAQEAAALRYNEGTIALDPDMLLTPRRQEDTRRDLYTLFNVVQENLVKGGVIGYNTQGVGRLVTPLKNIERSNNLNRDLWNLMERTADAVA